jgi:hypothetical protein
MLAGQRRYRIEAGAGLHGPRFRLWLIVLFVRALNLALNGLFLFGGLFGTCLERCLACDFLRGNFGH